VALGRLGADRELLVLEACGLSVRRMLGPVVGFAGAMTVLAIAMSTWIGPWASRSLDAKLMELARSHPSALILPGAVQEFGQWKLTAREVSADGRQMAGLALWFPRFGETIFAQRAEIEDVRGEAKLRLEHGLVVMEPRGKPRELRFDRMSVALPNKIESDFERNDNDRLTGMTLDQLTERSRDPETSRRNQLESLMEWHRRFALPVATLVFGVLALPLFLSRGQQSRAAGAVLGVGATVVYYGLVQVGNGLVMSETVDPGIAAWIPNVVMMGVALLLLARVGRSSSFARGRGSGDGLISSWRNDDSSSKAALAPAPEEEVELERVRERASPEPRAAAPAGPIRARRFALQRYIGGRFLQMALVAFLALMAAYLLVDVLERLQWFARYEATPSEAIRFYGFRIPLLASRVLPMSLLVATALTVALLGVQGELTGIRACGIPAPRALFPVIVICALIVPLSFVLNDEVVPRANSAADYLKNTEIKGRARAAKADGEKTNERRKPVWFGAGNRHYEADLLDPQLGTAHGLTVYELGEDGLPVRRLEIAQARHFSRGRWRLEDALELDIGPDGIVTRPADPVLSLGEAVPAEIDTMHLSVRALREEIEQVRAGGWDTTQLDVDLHVKFAAPLACLVLSALVLFFCVSGPPYPSTGVSLMVSGAIAVAWVLLTGVSVSLGYGGVLPPAMAGWAPTALFALAAGVMGWRLRGMR
jgi:lipopolysaccharide export system permease protein